MDKENLIHESLKKFYLNIEYKKIFFSIIQGGIVTKYTGLSLRIIDWFATRYAKTNRVMIHTKMPDGEYRYCNIHHSYKNNLKSYKKKLFDPCCRNNTTYKVYLDYNNIYIQTTVAQMNFIRWTITSGILDYILEHKSELEVAMTSDFKNNTANKQHGKKHIIQSSLNRLSKDTSGKLVSFN